MLILPQTIKTKWNSKHKSYYESKGYIYTKMSDEFEVDVLHLPISSQIKVRVTCDYCGKEFKVQYFRIQEKISCCHCRPKKTQELYGYSSTWQLENTKQTIKQSFLDKYGVDNNFKSPEVQEKRKQTFIKKYGVDHPLKSEIVKNKCKKTNLQRYGVEYGLANEDIKNKKKQTFINKYGVDNPFKNKEIMKKANINRLKSLYKNGNGICSKQQKHLYDLLGGELNYPIDNYLLDIVFLNEMIYIEYNGGGHNIPVKLGQISEKQFEHKEIVRYNYLKNKNWKLIRIVCSNDKLLEDNLIINLINECKDYLLNSNHSWIELNIDEMKIKCTEYEKYF